ncbi:DUF6620 family protein [uncultured Polaribacter sp.]|uniref:DUF6620 family protein n=1 Tax=uncultured Polaribacter sp. TaxID=174711 RepID=UPI00261C6613|nr:DUF6620 family protein [uncultured Polaribacter sp.]
MEEINGVSFRDYACASANLVAGMPVEKICEVLGIERPVWEATVEGWNNKMAELSHEDMAFYGAVFNNPKQGKFANVEGSASPKDPLELVPDVTVYAKILSHISAASDHGIDTVSVLEKEYDMNLLDWTKAGEHYGKLMTSIGDDMEKHNKIHIPFVNAKKQWDEHFNEKYKDLSANISDDIDF